MNTRIFLLFFLLPIPSLLAERVAFDVSFMVTASSSHETEGGECVSSTLIKQARPDFELEPMGEYLLGTWEKVIIHRSATETLDVTFIVNGMINPAKELILGFLIRQNYGLKRTFRFMVIVTKPGVRTLFPQKHIVLGPLDLEPCRDQFAVQSSGSLLDMRVIPERIVRQVHPIDKFELPEITFLDE